MKGQVDEFYEIYRTNFITVYADFVALTQTKPEQILIEESNMLSHVAQSHNPSLNKDIQDDNIKKAKNHLVRATLDLHKLVWAELRQRLDAFILDENRRLCFNASEKEVLADYDKFVEKGREARRYEMESIGVDPLNSISHYEEVNKIGYDLLGKIDKGKETRIRSILHAYKTKEFWFGVLASLVAAGIFSLTVFIFNKISAP